MAKRGHGGMNINDRPRMMETEYGYMNPWETARLNNATFLYYRNVIIQLAMARFRWVNLPETCNERFLERTLLYNGMATIAFPEAFPGKFLSLKCNGNGRPNKYGIPRSWIALGDDGTRFSCNSSNGVIIYDNETRYPLLMGIELYANELTHLRMTKRMNRLHQQVPFILKGPQEKKQDMVNLFKQVAGGEAAVLTTNGIDMIEYEAMSTGVQYIGEELAQDEVNVWNRIYTMLGIPNTTFKAERQTEDEIRGQKSPTDLIALASLNERRRAAHFLNKHFGSYLNDPIEVVWAQDNISENYNFFANIETQARMEVFDDMISNGGEE